MGHIQQVVELAPGQHTGEFACVTAQMQRLPVMVFGKELRRGHRRQKVGQGSDHLPMLEHFRRYVEGLRHRHSMVKPVF